MTGIGRNLRGSRQCGRTAIGRPLGPNYFSAAADKWARLWENVCRIDFIGPVGGASRRGRGRRGWPARAMNQKLLLSIVPLVEDTFIVQSPVGG